MTARQADTRQRGWGRWRRTSGWLLLGALLLAAPAAAAREKEKEKQQVDYVVSKWAYKRLTKATGLIDKKKYKEAIDVLQSMKRRSRLNPYEKALMYQTLGYVYAGLEKIPPAIKNLEECLATGSLPAGALLDTQYNLGQLYMVAKNYRKAISVFLDWIHKVDNPKPGAKFNLAMAFVQAKRYREALRWVNEAVGAVKRPKEQWLQLKLSVHFKLKQYRKVAQVLERLVSRFRKKTYWMQLAAIYSELKQEKKALAVLELAYLQGFLTSRGEIRNLISLYNYHNVPIKAARLLEEAMNKGLIKRERKSFEELADTWLRAREMERAARAMEQAARLADGGELYLRLAQIRIEQQKWKAAAAALARALAKGKLKRPGAAHLLRGVAFYYDRQWKKARAAFEKARGFKHSERNASQWLKTLDDKLKRLAQR
ncbi:MAG: hypothetical protein DRI34_04910 [Deltaproteobacteria bacterium]|nr:MAG: hypothetical protein DRI34_04910 [Deltaproteobacteria bacterium]